MQTEIAVEIALKPIFSVLDDELSNGQGEHNGALLRVAAAALQQFEWSTPQWAEEFAEKWDLQK